MRSANSNKFGLNENELRIIINVLKSYPAIERASIFGSRAKGNQKRGSDIDLVLFGKNLAPIITHISYQLNEEVPLPYFFDVVDYATISNQDIKDHIDRIGVIFFDTTQ